METVVVKKIQNQSVYSNKNKYNNNNNKQMKAPKKNYPRSFSHNQAPSFNGYGGLFQYPKPSHPYYHQYHQQNPPLLPLPTPTVTIHGNSSLPCNTRKLSRPTNSIYSNIPTPRGKMNNPLKNNPEKQPEPKSNSVAVPSCFVVGSEISFVSPPPSSLPLPRFSLRPPTVSKLTSTVGIDACATDSLRQMLHIH